MSDNRNVVVGKIEQLTNEAPTVGASSLTDLLNLSLKSAIEQMAIEINMAPDDAPSITMKPKLWLLWEKILHESGVEPDIKI